MNSKPKVLFTVPRHNLEFNNLWNREAIELAEKYGFFIDLPDADLPSSKPELNKLLCNYDATISSWGAPSLDKEILSGNHRLKIVGHAAGSVADLVTDAVYERGIKVVSANDTMAQCVAEWCLSSTLMGFGRTFEFAGIGNALSMNWEKRKLSRSIKDATIGIWGFGNITRHYIDYLKPLAPRRVMVNSKYTPEATLRDCGVHPVTLEEMFATSDVLVLLAGLNSSNLGKIDGALLRSIKDNAVFINCGRARLVDESALMTELRKNRFAAFMDVFYEEPLPLSNELRQLHNVFMTPHVGGIGGIKRFVPDVLENFQRFFNGLPLRGEITKERAVSMTSHNMAFIK